MLLDSNLNEAREGKRITAKGYAVQHKRIALNLLSFHAMRWAKMIF